jgi:hypothetical protein
VIGQGEIVGGDDAGAGEEDRAVDEFLAAEKVLGEVGEGAFDLVDVGFAPKHLLPARQICNLIVQVRACSSVAPISMHGPRAQDPL